MWTIYEKKSLHKVVSKLPTPILKHYEIWKRVIELEGIKGLKLIKGFKDGALKGNWAGYRSSRLNKQWRTLTLPKALRVHPAVLLFPDFDIADVA